MRINCHIPITLRLTGVPSDDQLAEVGRVLARLVAMRLAQFERHCGEATRSLTLAYGRSGYLDAAGESGDGVRFTPASLPEPPRPRIGSVSAVTPAASDVDDATAGGVGPRVTGPAAEHLGESMLAQEEQRQQAAAHGLPPGFALPPGAQQTPDPFREALDEALAEAAALPKPADPIMPGDTIQQHHAVALFDAMQWWGLQRVQDSIRQQAERLAAWHRARPNPDPAMDADHFMEVFFDQFKNSITYILESRLTQKYKGKSLTVHGLRISQLADAEAALLTPPPPDAYGAQNRALWAMGVVTRVQQVRDEAAEKWRTDIERAVGRFLVLARNETDFLTIHQNATPVSIFGLPEWLEGTVPASANPDLVVQGSDPLAPTVIRLMRALRTVYGPHVLADNYGGHPQGSSYVGNIEEVGQYSFDLALIGEKNSEGFYDRAEALRFFRALNRAARATGIAWVAYYNDFEVAREINEALGQVRVGFSGAGTPRDAPTEKQGSIHHGPDPYILHIHINVMPISTAGQFLANSRFSPPPTIDLRGAE